MTTWAQVGCIWRQARADAAARWYGWLMGRPVEAAVVPAGTTHVLAHLPAFLLEDPAPEDAGGWWEIQALGDYLAGASCSSLADRCGPGCISKADLAEFAEETLGYPVRLTRDEVNIADPASLGAGPAGATWSTEPVFYIGPALTAPPEGIR